MDITEHTNHTVWIMLQHVTCTVQIMLQYEVCPKSNEDDFKKNFLLNIQAITVYFLQNRLLVIEYSDSSVAATLHCNEGSLRLRCPRCSCLDVFNCPKMMSFEWVLSLGNKKKLHRAKSGLYGGWGSVMILF